MKYCHIGSAVNIIICEATMSFLPVNFTVLSNLQKLVIANFAYKHVLLMLKIKSSN